MFCRNCGNQIPDGAKFCSSCGAQQTDTHSTTQPITPQNQQPTPDAAKPKSKKGLKIAGWILVALNLVALINDLSKGTFTDHLYDGYGLNLSWYIGYFFIGIIGVILLIKAYKKEK